LQLTFADRPSLTLTGRGFADLFPEAVEDAYPNEQQKTEEYRRNAQGKES